MKIKELDVEKLRNIQLEYTEKLKTLMHRGYANNKHVEVARNVASSEGKRK